MTRAITNFISEVLIPLFVSIFYAVQYIKELNLLSAGDISLLPNDAGMFFIRGFIFMIIVPIVCVFDLLIYFEQIEKPSVGSELWQIKLFATASIWVLFIISVIDIATNL